VPRDDAARDRKHTRECRSHSHARNYYFQNTPRKCSKPQEAPLRGRSAFSVRTVKRLSAIESSRIRTTEERGRTLGYDGEVGRCVSEYRLADDSRGIELEVISVRRRRRRRRRQRWWWSVTQRATKRFRATLAAVTAACRSEHAKLCSASRPRRATKNIGESMSRLDLGLQNLSAMAHQTRSLPQLRIKFCATVAASLQIVLLLTVLPQGKFAGRTSDTLRRACTRHYSRPWFPLSLV
jgi:hypothetical protein